MIVVSDTTPIISLSKIKRLDLLRQLFGEVRIPASVYDELTSNPNYSDESEMVENAGFLVVNVNDGKAVELLRRATGLDLGESEAIIYSDDCKANLLLMDEVKGRKVAKQMGLTVMGTIGILMAAYNEKIVSKEEIQQYISVMRDTGRHISENLYDQLLDFIECVKKSL